MSAHPKPSADPDLHRTFVVVNPASAGGKTLRRWPDILAALRGAGVAVRPHLTGRPGEATDCTREALRAGVQRIVAVGGDGTLNEVLNGWFEKDGSPVNPDAVVGLMPSGTGGDFGRRALGLSSDIDRNARLIADGDSRRIDVGRVEFGDGAVRFFVNIADCGIGGEVVDRVNRSAFKGGGLRGTAVFLSTSLRTLMTFGGREVSVEVDGATIRRRVQQVVIANGRAFGGGMLVAPDAELDDGLFDVIVVAEMSRLQALRAMPSLYRGTHLANPAIEHRRAARVVVRPEQGDELLFDLEGEQFGKAPATITCLPKALNIIAPS
jgi:diacylglycerol kinase (ATP)